MSSSSCSRRLPPFTALRGFEAAARRLSFKEAAEELCLSQSAISHQVKVLERFVGRPLFHRSPTGVTLTETGAAFLEDLGPIFADLARATDRVLGAERDRPLTVRCSTGFATTWLFERLEDARCALGGIEIAVSTGLTGVADAEEADVTINCGYALPPRPGVEVFMESRRAPVCSPDFLQRYGPVEMARDVLALPLLREREGDEWATWIDHHACGEEPGGMCVELDDWYVATSAAVAGLGVALGHLTLIRRELAEGRLVQVVSGETSLRAIYTLTSPAGWRKDPRITGFREWMYAQVDKTAGIDFSPPPVGHAIAT